MSGAIICLPQLLYDPMGYGASAAGDVRAAWLQHESALAHYQALAFGSQDYNNQLANIASYAGHQLSAQQALAQQISVTRDLQSYAPSPRTISRSSVIARFGFGGRSKARKTLQHNARDGASPQIEPQ
jgi:hypothetical protein